VLSSPSLEHICFSALLAHYVPGPLGRDVSGPLGRDVPGLSGLDVLAILLGHGTRIASSGPDVPDH